MKIWKTCPHYEVYHERSAFPRKFYFYDISFFIFQGLVEVLSSCFGDELILKIWKFCKSNEVEKRYNKYYIILITEQ